MRNFKIAQSLTSKMKSFPPFVLSYQKKPKQEHVKNHLNPKLEVHPSYYSKKKSLGSFKNGTRPSEPSVTY